MNFRRLMGRAANNVLKNIKLELVNIGRDFDARLESKIHIDRAIRSVAEELEVWLRMQNTWKLSSEFNVLDEVKLFYCAYLDSPFRDCRGGSRFGNLLWLYLLAKLLDPDIIVDSGTYTGGSAWALATGARRAKVTSFDIDLSRLIERVAKVEYVNADWTSVNYNNCGEKRLVYFDDHVSQGQRLQEAANRNFEFAIFDDDYSVIQFPPMAYGGAALPKISFILDETLEDGEIIEWSVSGRKYHWTVDKRNLDGLKNYICSAERLPNLAEVFGIDQLPYRIVKVRVSSSE